MNTPAVLKSSGREIIEADWGRLVWFASGKLGNSADMTAGQCIIKPGCENPLHSHPNCSEVLHVVQGAIMHTAAGGAEVRLAEGDTIVVPPDFPHQARNVGDIDAVLLIAFSSADRQVKGE